MILHEREYQRREKAHDVIGYLQHPILDHQELLKFDWWLQTLLSDFFYKGTNEYIFSKESWRHKTYCYLAPLRKLSFNDMKTFRKAVSSGNK